MLAARASRYVGILNGIDTTVWNPAAIRFLPARLRRCEISPGRPSCKRALLERFGLPIGDDARGASGHRAGVAAGRAEGTGSDRGGRRCPRRHRRDVGSSWAAASRATKRSCGDSPRDIRRASARFIGFDEPLAHLVEAGADMFLMPSKFEPCGLNQMYSLRYGTVPIVHAVGGLDDTIQPYTSRALRANGFKFRERFGRRARARRSSRRCVSSRISRRGSG